MATYTVNRTGSLLPKFINSACKILPSRTPLFYANIGLSAEMLPFIISRKLKCRGIDHLRYRLIYVGTLTKAAARVTTIKRQR